jgi:hypothetical protein
MKEKSTSTYSNKTRLSKLVQNTTLWLGVCLFCIITGTTYLFLTNVTENSLHGSRFQEQEIIKKDLEDRNQSLKIQILEASSSEEVDSSYKVQKMVSASEVEYMETNKSTITKK